MVQPTLPVDGPDSRRAAGTAGLGAIPFAYPAEEE